MHSVKQQLIDSLSLSHTHTHTLEKCTAWQKYWCQPKLDHLQGYTPLSDCGREEDEEEVAHYDDGDDDSDLLRTKADESQE